MDPVELAELEALVGDWLTVPDVSERVGRDIMKVRQMLAEGELAAVRVGGVLKVPALFLVDGPGGAGGSAGSGGADGRAVPLPDLKGTLTLLGDARYTTAEAVRWLYTPDGTLHGGTPGGHPAGGAEDRDQASRAGAGVLSPSRSTSGGPAASRRPARAARERARNARTRPGPATATRRGIDTLTRWVSTW